MILNRYPNRKKWFAAHNMDGKILPLPRNMDGKLIREYIHRN